jgi:hypothetical protein
MAKQKLRFKRLLQAAGFESYSDYLQSPHWKRTRVRVMERAKRRCHACDARAEVIHHVTYRHLGKERERDLIAVCRECHERIHQALDARYPQARSVAYKAERTAEVFEFLFNRPLWEQFDTPPKARKRRVRVHVTVQINLGKRCRQKRSKKSRLKAIDRIRAKQSEYAEQLAVQKAEKKRLEVAAKDPFEQSIAHLSFAERIQARIERRTQEQRAG